MQRLYAYALPGSTARQLFISSTLLVDSARQLDSYSSQQTSTDLDKTRRTGTWSQPRQAQQGSTGKASTTGSTAPRRSLDSSTAVDSQGSSGTAAVTMRVSSADPAGSGMSCVSYRRCVRRYRDSDRIYGDGARRRAGSRAPGRGGLPDRGPSG